MKSWLLIDDSPEEAASFAVSLSISDELIITSSSVKDAEESLVKGTLAPAGILMDVDLSNEAGRQHTGPGMSQDMRIAQMKKSLPPFPIVRFSLRHKVLENIGRDASSDDIFDLKIEKDGLSNEIVRASVQNKLIGVRKIYDALEGGFTSLPTLVGLSDELWLQWGSPAFQSDFEVGDRVHLQAGPLIRMMIHPGLLIDEDILAFRLGVDVVSSKGWARLADNLADFKYRGVGSCSFDRWWARGLEDWWQEKLAASMPMAGCTIAQRIELLSNHFEGLAPLQMPKGSMGDRPWRYCFLIKEIRQDIIPVDPSRAVKIKSRSPMPTWLDPLYASLGAALECRDDPRVDQADVKRLQLFARSQK